LGFLASQELLDEASPNGETVGNLGFWDQRLAIEWTYANIADFGGDKNNITIGGLSAGAYSTFHQLAHELGRPDNEAIIRRVVLHSNGCGLPPKDLREVQSHFDTLLEALEAPYGLQAKGKLAFLRSLPTEKLIDAVSLLPENSFRAVNDGQWVRHSLFREIENGTFARVMLKRGIKIMIGDVPDERNEYKRVQPPNSYENLVRRLSVEYPVSAAEKLARMYCPGRNVPTGSNWTETFGRIYADMQVHVTERGLLAALAKSLPLSSIYRYRINWRAKCVEKYMPLEMGVSHGSDIPIWFFGNGTELEENEKPVLRKWLEPFGKFLEGEELEWGTGRIEDVRALKADMSIGVMRDEDWYRCSEVWRDLQRVKLSRL
jgi:carboxylesterase type B